MAAGASSRMGHPKASLSLTDRTDTFLTRLVRTLQAARMPEVVVVSVAHDAEILRLLLPRDPRVRIVRNADWPQGQLTSLHAALRLSSRTTRDEDVEAVLMTLVDVPLVSPATVSAVVGAWRRTRAPIVRPARGDAHGHPVVFDRAIFAELLNADPAVGAKAVVRAHRDDILDLPIEDEGAFLDVDTADEYQALRHRLAGEAAPASVQRP